MTGEKNPTDAGRPCDPEPLESSGKPSRADAKARAAELGRRGEAEAARYVESLGWHILGKNLRTRGSEIDLACRAGNELVFVEVRVRSLGRMQPPETTVGPQKLGRLTRGGRVLAAQWKWEGPWRIDLVAFTVDRNGVWCREHLEDITAGGWDPWGSCRG